MHRSDSDYGARVLAIWPNGKEVKAFKEEGLREISLISFFIGIFLPHAHEY